MRISRMRSNLEKAKETLQSALFAVTTVSVFLGHSNGDTGGRQRNSGR